MDFAMVTTNQLGNIPITTKKPLTANSSEFEKYNAFLAEALERCANVRTPYDRDSELPLTPEELEKLCYAAANLGLPVTYIGYTVEDNVGSYAAYPNWDMLYEVEKER